MPVSKKPRKAHKGPQQRRPKRLTATPFSTVEIRVRLGEGFSPSHFDHLAMAQRLTCLLRVSEAEERVINALAEKLCSLRTFYLESGSLDLSKETLAVVLDGVSTMEAVWARYPRAHLEVCYDQVLMELCRKTHAAIERAESDTSNA